MALADLMKKGFITSATATFATVDDGSGNTASSVAPVAKVAADEIQNDETAIKSVATVAVAAAQIQIPRSQESGDWRAKLVAEFMEVDGLSLEQAQAMAAISVEPRTPAVWLSMIADLNALINTYCASAKVSEEAKDRIRGASYSQSLASIPHAIDWFRAELRALENSHTKARYDD
jgi:hypothetical protein